ncbi:hypothetical protein, partial [Chitiniphilus shinanonensis]
DKKADAALRAACEGSNQFACDVERYKAQQAANTYPNLGYQNPKEQQAGYQQIMSLLYETSPEAKQARLLEEAKLYNFSNFFGLDEDSGKYWYGYAKAATALGTGILSAIALNKAGLEGDIAGKPVKPVKPTTAPRDPSPVDAEMVGQDRPVAPLQGGIPGVPATLGRANGTYSYVNPGPLPDNLAGTFTGGRYTVMTLEKDTVLYRAGSSSQPLGQFFSLEKPNGILQERIDKAVLPVWPGGAKSPIDTAFEVKIPAGTKVYVGEVAPQGGVYVGGTQQIVVEKPWLINGVKVIDSSPLK